MLLFCPNCSSMLCANDGGDGWRFSCNACPFVYDIRSLKSKRTYMKMKELDDVLGGAAAWANVDSTEERCPKCEHPRAYFMQIQTRSADEPMTTFYKCCNPTCNHRWRD